jgi:hypothetical protein
MPPYVRLFSDILTKNITAQPQSPDKFIRHVEYFERFFTRKPRWPALSIGECSRPRSGATASTKFLPGRRGADCRGLGGGSRGVTFYDEFAQNEHLAEYGSPCGQHIKETGHSRLETRRRFCNTVRHFSASRTRYFKECFIERPAIFYWGARPSTINIRLFAALCRSGRMAA